jgi:peptide/nickel transport system permease protein
MGNYILKRLLAMLPVIFLVSVIVFFLIRLTPGDPAVAMLGEEATPQMIAVMRKEFGLDQPIPVQYGIWLSKVVQGDLGNSTRSHQPFWSACRRPSN